MASSRKTSDASEKKAPDDTDRHVGQQLRLRRAELGMSQTELGAALGVTFQQVQKYEKGTNRISAGRLQQASTVLDVPLGYFYERRAAELSPGFAEDSASAYVADDPAVDDGRNLLRAFRRIDDPLVRRRLVELIESLAMAQSKRRKKDVR